MPGLSMQSSVMSVKTLIVHLLYFDCTPAVLGLYTCCTVTVHLLCGMNYQQARGGGAQ